jgi:peroxiredoxin family protein
MAALQQKSGACTQQQQQQQQRQWLPTAAQHRAVHTLACPAMMDIQNKEEKSLLVVDIVLL